MRRRPQCLALTILTAFGVAVCAPACAPPEAPEQVEDPARIDESRLTTSACPVSGAVSQGFHGGHDGVDLAAPIGTPIYAVAAGVITASGPAQGYGQWIRIKHDDGSMTEYGHMKRRDVKVGDRVNAGQQIAIVGSEGQSTGPHLHLRTYRTAGDGHGIDPRGYLTARGISLPCAGAAPGAGSGSDGTKCPGGRGMVVGKIQEKYLALGGCSSALLGLPVTDEQTAPDTRGRYSVFERGSIYWTPETEAHEVHGEFRDLWMTLGWERGVLGYPTTDETAASDARGRFSLFQHGAIYWTETTKAHEVVGAILDRYKELGAETGALGYPTSGEYDVPGGRRSDFEHGSITSISATKEVVVSSN